MIFDRSSNICDHDDLKNLMLKSRKIGYSMSAFGLTLKIKGRKDAAAMFTEP